MYKKEYHLKQIDDALNQKRRDILADGRTKPSATEAAEGKYLLELRDKIDAGAEIDFDASMDRPIRPNVGGKNMRKAETAIKPANDKSYRGMFYPNESNKTFSNDEWRSTGEFMRTFLGGRYDPRFQQVPVEEIRAMGGTVGSEGGFLIPEAYSQQLMDASLAREIVRARCKVYPMVSSDLYVPGWDDLDGSGGDTAGFTMQWLAESQTATANTGKVRSIHLKAKTGAVYANVTLELMQDSPAFERDLNAILAKAIGRGIDKAILNSKDVGGPRSILNSPCLVTCSKDTGQSAGTLNYANVSQMFSRMLDHEGAIWVTNHATLPELLTLGQAVGTGGSHIKVLREDSGTYHLLGRPIVFTDLLPTLGTKGDLIFANFNYYALGLRKEVFALSTNADRWLQREHSFMVGVRLDGEPSLAKVVTPENGETLSPFVCLETRS